MAQAAYDIGRVASSKPAGKGLLAEKSRKECLTDNEKAIIAAQVQAILMSVGIALIRIRARKGEFPELGIVETQYEALQQRAEHILHSIANPDAWHCLHALRSQEACLESLLNRCMHDTDKINATTPVSFASNPAVIEDAIKAHPLMLPLNERLLVLTSISIMNHGIKRHVLNIRAGSADMAAAVAAATLVTAAGGINTAALGGSVQKAVDIMAAQAQAEEESARAAGATPKEVMSRREQVREAIQLRARRIYNAAIHISSGGREHAQERAMHVYDEFIAKPAAAFKANYPAYCDKAKMHLGERADSWRTHMDALSAHIEKMRNDLMNSPNLEDMGGMINTLSPLTGICVKELDIQAGIVNGEIKRVKQARQALSDVLSGKSEDIQGVSEMLAVPVKEISEQVAEFHAGHGIHAVLHEKLRGICASVDGLFRGKGNDKNTRPH